MGDGENVVGFSLRDNFKLTESGLFSFILLVIKYHSQLYINIYSVHFDMFLFLRQNLLYLHRKIWKTYQKYQI